jgi:hypothetical protein
MCAQAPLERQHQLRGLRYVIYTIGRFFGQRRIAFAGQALESVRAVRPTIAPHLAGVHQPLEAPQVTFPPIVVQCIGPTY